MSNGKREKRGIKPITIYVNAYETAFIETVQKVTGQSKSEILRDALKICINGDYLIKKK